MQAEESRGAIQPGRCQLEDLPASDRRADAVYLDEVAQCGIYLAKYIERMGTGTGDMIRLCRDAGLREPEYDVRDGFVQTLWRPPPQVTAQDTGQAGPALLIYFQETRTTKEIQDAPI